MKDMFCYIAATNHVNLSFCRGSSIPDLHRVLDGKVMRHSKTALSCWPYAEM
jgi:hypothetical protein